MDGDRRQPRRPKAIATIPLERLSSRGSLLYILGSSGLVIPPPKTCTRTHGTPRPRQANHQQSHTVDLLQAPQQVQDDLGVALVLAHRWFVQYQSLGCVAHSDAIAGR